MSRTPDHRHGELFEDDGILLGTTSISSLPGEIRFDGSKFSLTDAVGEYDPRSGGGISPVQHQALDTLVHDIAETCYYELTYGVGNRVTAETWWTSAAKITKVRETAYMYSGTKVSTETTRQYDGSGILVSTLVTTYSYSGNKIISALCVYSEP
jgi:hypothetical protein